MNPKYQLKTLQNGLRVLLVPMPQVKSVTSLLLVKTGSRHEENQQAGISHFLEHMVFKGTKKYPSALKLASTVDGVGAEFNAFTGKECTGFYVKSSSNHLDLSLEVLKELVFYPLIPGKEIEKEKGVIIEEINMYEDQPMSKVGENFEILIYGLSALGRKVIGGKQTVASLKRENFLDYQKHWYHPENMVLCLAGAVGKALPKLKAWSQLDQEGKRQKLSFIEDYPLQRPGLKLAFKKTEQAHFCLGVPGFKIIHKDRYVLSVLSTVLGGNMSSRLFTEVREKRGLAYYVRTSTGRFQDTGYLVSQAGVDLNKLEKAVTLIRKEYQKLSTLKFQISSEELERTKEYLKGHFVLGLEDSKGVASLFADSLLFEGKIRMPEEILQGIEKVTRKDVLRVGKELFAEEKLYLSVIGPYKDRQRFLKLL